MTSRLAALAFPALLLSPALAPALVLGLALAPAPAAAQSSPGGPPVEAAPPGAQNPPQNPPQYQPQNQPQYQPGMQYQDPGARAGARGITRQEFVARAAQLAAERFDQMDTNHDGVVTQQERMAYWRARRAGGGAPVTVHDGPPGGP